MSCPSSRIDPSGATQVEHLYRAHHGWLLGRLRNRTGNGDLAADLAHDAFERVMRMRAADLAVMTDAPRAYLTTIAKSLLASHHRRVILEQAYLETLAARPEAHHPSVEEQALILEALDAAWRVLDGLPQRTRRIFLMAQFDGLSQRDIADRMGLTPNAVQKAITRALLHCYQAVYG